MEAQENSGSTTISTGTGEVLAVIWDRKRDGPLKVRARAAGTAEFPAEQIGDLFQRVNASSQARETEEFHRAWSLQYKGRAWRGELWLDDRLRLGPPSRQDERAQHGPRIILVNSLVKGIDQLDAQTRFEVTMRELSVFLSVVMGQNVRKSPNGGRGWTWSRDPSGQPESEVRDLGYCEKHWSNEMPTTGQVPPVPFRKVSRPDFSLQGDDGTQTELHPPEDIGTLWHAFMGLSPDRRRQFVQAGSMWQLAVSLDHEHQTTRFFLICVACEALKPPDNQFRKHNINDVVEALLGQQKANRLRAQEVQAQKVRNAHAHQGEFQGSEFVQQVMMSNFQDPTFDAACRELYQIAQAAIIEWLGRGGTFTMPLKRWRRRRSWFREHAISILPVVLIVGVGIGCVLGWFLR